MAYYRLPNRVRQAGTYQVSTPDYVTLVGGGAENGFQTFATAATAESWATGDYVGILIYKDDANQAVWVGTWDATFGRIAKLTEEFKIGTLASDDTVIVSAVATTSMLTEAMLNPYRGNFVAVSASTYTIQESDAGKTICTSNAVGCVITIPDTLPVGFQCQIVQEGAGAVSVISSGTDTLNGQAEGSPWRVLTRYAGTFLYQRVEGAWIATGTEVPV